MSALTIVFLVFLVAMVAMHLRGHGHGGHAHGNITDEADGSEEIANGPATPSSDRDEEHHHAGHAAP